MLTIGTINWKELEHTSNFIESLKVIEQPFNLYIWNNEDSEVYQKAKYFQENYINKLALFNMKNYKITSVNHNLGLPIAWNWILSEFQHDKDSEYAMLCDNDIRFTKTINDIFPFMRHNEAFGLVCPAMLPRETDLEKLEEVAQEYVTNVAFNKNLIEMGGLNGPCRVIPKYAFEEVGFFDPWFKFSFDDMDYHQRVQKAGFGTCVYHGSAVWHYGGASTGKLGMTIDKNPYYARFLQKHG